MVGARFSHCEAQIKEEGILDILTEAGFLLRQPGCSACLAMNDDKIPAGKYAVSTSNRNFGRSSRQVHAHYWLRH
jgi:homoaconitase/3-isopropylmalate dehydratase large subunit